MYSTKATHQPKSFFHQLRPVLVVMVEPTTGTIAQINMSMTVRAYIKPICNKPTMTATSPPNISIPEDSDSADMSMIFLPKFVLASPVALSIIHLLSASLKM